MNATPEPHVPIETDFDDYEDEGFGETLPVRPRRPFLTKWTALLMALVLAAVGFYAGVRIEKSKTTSTSSSGTSALARAFSGAGGTSTTRSTSGTGGGNFPGSGTFGGASNATIGSVSSVKSNILYVTETSGNTVKVKLSGSTSVTKSESVSKSKIYPGDEVVITGSSSKGTVKATKVTDSGASSTGSSSTSSTGSSSSSISSLFGGS